MASAPRARRSPGLPLDHHHDYGCQYRAPGSKPRRDSRNRGFVLRTDQVLAGMLVIGLLGLGMDRRMSVGERAIRRRWGSS
jgi:hypothetical protein